ncbi:MAG TPA: MotA/TolQ/ExbB proton channel family protein [Proteobacteria bacterium]|nr:MotA/TolQ/ExbB proton channel family protein [Pseudomonadota bacterium]
MELLYTAFRDGGPVMYVIALVSGIAIAILIERVYQLYFRFSINASEFTAQLSRLIRGGQLKKAISLCDAAPNAALARVAKAALLKAGQDERTIQSAVDEVALEVLPKIQKRIDHLQVIANIATLLGLLGTIIGIIIAFKAVAEVEPAMKQQVLTRGIAIALYTTAFGLTVAIPSLFAHAVVKAKATKLVDELDEHSVKIINLLNEARDRGLLAAAQAQTANPGDYKGS